MKSLQLPTSAKILLMISALTLGGAYLLLGQQAPSEESDWPWKVVTESKVFLNGAPVAKLSNLSPLTKKLGVQFDQARRAGKLDSYTEPPVMIVADIDTSIGKVADLSWSVIEGTGEPILVTKTMLESPSTGSKANPNAFIVTTENVDIEKAKRLTMLSDSEMSEIGNRISIVSEDNPDALRFARTYESSIEIGSDGRYFLNERTGKTANRASSNVEGRMSNPAFWAFNSNQALPAAPLKQTAVPRAELASAVAKLVNTAKTESQKILIIASEKARYESLLQVLSGIEKDASVILLVRKVQSR